jgi:hypothetical protein
LRFKPQLASNREIKIKTTHTNYRILVGGPRGPSWVFKDQKALKLASKWLYLIITSQI